MADFLTQFLTAISLKILALAAAMVSSSPITCGQMSRSSAY
ncbi:MAG: hypothetical protein ACC628_12790 [Pirellulaceae bacterium]